VISKDAVPVRAEVQVHEMEETGETVVANEARGELVVLNASGAAVWYLANGERSVAAITSELASRFGDPERIGADVEAFLEDLARRGLLRFRDPRR
jgi:coenzyme PQQ biosynthesis protein PqqD